MATLHYTLLTDRGLIAVTGPDAERFLQDLITNDVSRASGGAAIYAALLTPQGKYLFDFFVIGTDDGFLLDCEGSRTDALLKRLKMYKLRANLDLTPRGDDVVAVVFGDGAVTAFGLEPRAGAGAPFGGGKAYVDPRLSDAGVRMVLPREGAAEALTGAGATPAAANAYERLRLGLGLPDGSRDLIVDKTVLLEANFEELNGLDFQKGCYVGQEVTARTKYRGLVKRRLFPVEIDGPTPEPGTAIMQDGKDAGTLQSACDGLGLALLRLDRLEEQSPEAAALSAGETRIRPLRPDWMASA